MSAKRIYELPEGKHRESTIKLDWLIARLSSCNIEGSIIHNDLLEMLLCLANEITMTKKQLKKVIKKEKKRNKKLLKALKKNK